MKNKAFVFLSITFAVVIGFSSCNKDENLAPTFKSAAVSTDNKTITVTFSEAVYSKADATGALDANSLSVTAPAETKFTYTVTHTAGSTTATINLAITSVIQGTEVFTIKAASATAIYDNEGKAMDAAEVIATNSASKDLGIVGEWYSSGSNVAVLLSYYFKVDSIYANFKANNTYHVESFSKGAKTTYEGVFVQTIPTTGTIWTIVLNQSTPTAVTSEGIFEITKATAGYTMKYEVVQTTPSIGATPPTVSGGFGSSSAGAYGTTNVQTFKQIVR
jgi:hypothetical protein